MPSSVPDRDRVVEPWRADEAQDDEACPPCELARKRGRPKVDAVSVRVSTWLPLPMADKLIRVAQARDESISKLVRSLLALRLK